MRNYIDFVEEGRRIQMDLRPSMLDDLSLLSTLSWFCRRFRAIYSGIQVEQGIGIEEGDIPPPLKVIASRVTQEAMNNAPNTAKQILCVCACGDWGAGWNSLSRTTGGPSTRKRPALRRL
jgi:signal transduction histidine kinase